VNTFVNTVVSALSLGALYALIALGYTMVYGILRFINFAHSDVFMLGAWIAYVVAGALGMGARRRRQLFARRSCCSLSMADLRALG
jgi:branched-chain amino acid transport system permease protein